MSQGICAVIVTFRPDAGKLLDLVTRIRGQVQKIVIVDNASPDLPPLPEAELIRNQTNVGLAGALNQGIERAMAAGFELVVLFDQDSKPNPDMVIALQEDLENLMGRGAKIAAIGPSIVDVRNATSLPFVRFGFPLNRKIPPADWPVSCDFLITSGTLIPVGVLRNIGLMREGLFIDNIDMEWCARAKHCGFTLYGSARAKMLHELGDDLLTLPVVGRTVAVHSATRLYYFMRNRVLLYRLKHVSRTWVAQDLLRIPVKLAIFSLLVPGRLHNLKYMLKGLAHGIAGVEGMLPTSLSPSPAKGVA
jgi:rhamnosyltransferase